MIRCVIFNFMTVVMTLSCCRNKKGLIVMLSKQYFWQQYAYVQRRPNPIPIVFITLQYIHDLFEFEAIRCLAKLRELEFFSVQTLELDSTGKGICVVVKHRIAIDLIPGFSNKSILCSIFRHLCFENIQAHSALKSEKSQKFQPKFVTFFSTHYCFYHYSL